MRENISLVRYGKNLTLNYGGKDDRIWKAKY
jgi:hypothetical protein